MNWKRVVIYSVVMLPMMGLLTFDKLSADSYYLFWGIATLWFFSILCKEEK